MMNQITGGAACDRLARRLNAVRLAHFGKLLRRAGCAEKRWVECADVFAQALDIVAFGVYRHIYDLKILARSA